MTYDKGQYKAEHWEGHNEFVVVGPGWENTGGTYTKNEASIAARFANLAYAEGRKAAENDLKDLLRMANKLRGFDTVFDAWKKARGIK